MPLYSVLVSDKKDMSPYDKDVNKKLGKQVLALLIRNVNEGKINSQQSDDIARLLAENLPGSVIYGSHINRVKIDGWNQAEFRQILANWYCEEMFDLDREAALEKLVNIFGDTTVCLHPLAKEVRELMHHREPKKEHEGKRCIMCYKTFCTLPHVSPQGEPKKKIFWKIFKWEGVGCYLLIENKFSKFPFKLRLYTGCFL